MIKLFSQLVRDTWTFIKHPKRDYDRELFNPIPKNCEVEVCPYPAKNRDKDKKYFCVTHSDRGRWG